MPETKIVQVGYAGTEPRSYDLTHPQPAEDGTLRTVFVHPGDLVEMELPVDADGDPVPPPGFAVLGPDGEPIIPKAVAALIAEPDPAAEPARPAAELVTADTPPAAAPATPPATPEETV